MQRRVSERPLLESGFADQTVISRDNLTKLNDIHISNDMSIEQAQNSKLPKRQRKYPAVENKDESRLFAENRLVHLSPGLLALTAPNSSALDEFNQSHRNVKWSQPDVQSGVQG